MKSLAYTPPKNEDGNEAQAMPASSSGPQYPSLRFNGEQATEGGFVDCRYGEEYEIKMRVRLTSINGGMSYPGSGTDKENPSIEFDVLACDPPSEVKSSKKGPAVKGPKEAGVYSTQMKREEEE